MQRPKQAKYEDNHNEKEGLGKYFFCIISSILCNSFSPGITENER